MVLINIIAIHPNFLSSPLPHPCHSLFFSRDDLQSPSGIISGPGSFAIRDHLRSRDHLWTRTYVTFCVFITKLRPVGGLELETTGRANIVLPCLDRVSSKPSLQCL